MNPAKRKKLQRLSLVNPVVKNEQEKVIQKEEVKEILDIKETKSEIDNKETEVKLADVQVENIIQTETKKEKKKKWSSQDV